MAVVTMGFSVSQHYCGDRLISVSVNETAESCCGPEGDCCQNEVIYVQLDDDFVIDASNIKQPTPDQGLVYVCSEYIIVEDFAKKINHKQLFADSSPPLDLPTYLASIQTYLL
jgi:hypothetical protein